MRIRPAQAAADTTVDHGRDRVAAQGVWVVLDGQCRAAREPDARVVARAGVLVDAVLDPHGSPALREILRDHRPQPALALELALALGNDHLEAFCGRSHRLSIGFRYGADVVVVDRAQPAHADSFEGLLDRI